MSAAPSSATSSAPLDLATLAADLERVLETQKPALRHEDVRSPRRHGSDRTHPPAEVGPHA